MLYIVVILAEKGLFSIHLELIAIRFFLMSTTSTYFLSNYTKPGQNWPMVSYLLLGGKYPKWHAYSQAYKL